MTAAVLEQQTQAAPPRRRERLTPEQYVDRHGPSGTRTARRDKAVLKAIARRADWKAWSWGENAFRSAEKIGAEIGYSERSVRYAYKSLIAAGWLSIEPRPGRTNIFTVRRNADLPLHVVAVDEPAAGPSVVAEGAARTAADRVPLPPATPPEGPPSACETAVGAAAPAHAAPDAPRPGAPPAATAASSSAQAGAEPHRGDAGAGRVPERAGPSPGAVAPASTRPLAAVPAGFGRGLTPRRDAARRSAPCPTCGVLAGESCRGRGGRLRVALHRARQPTPEALAELRRLDRLELAPATPPWCGRCDHPDSRHLEVTPDVWARCPACHPLRDGGPAP